MENCLVTKLKSSVQNSGLIRLGELEVELLRDADYNPLLYFTYGTVKEHTVRVLKGDGHILERDTEEDMGESFSMNGNQLFFKIPHTDGGTNAYMTIAVSDKEDLLAISTGYMYGGTLDVKYIPNLTTIESQLGLNISTSVDFLNTKHYTKFEAQLEENNIEITRLNSIVVDDTLSLLKPSGYVAPFVGDISQVSAGISLFKVAGDFIWNTVRPANAPVLVLWGSKTVAGYGCCLGNYVDAYLNNCVNGVDTLKSDPAYKTIYIYGERTSASDAAVTTLKGRGYSITVNEIEL